MPGCQTGPLQQAGTTEPQQQGMETAPATSCTSCMLDACSHADSRCECAVCMARATLHGQESHHTRISYSITCTRNRTQHRHSTGHWLRRTHTITHHRPPPGKPIAGRQACSRHHTVNRYAQARSRHTHHTHTSHAHNTHITHTRHQPPWRPAARLRSPCSRPLRQCHKVAHRSPHPPEDHTGGRRSSCYSTQTRAPQCTTCCMHYLLYALPHHQNLPIKITS